MTVQKKILDLTGSQYLVQKVKSAINDVGSSLSTHIADTDIHVTTADKNKWNNQTYVFRYSSTALVASSTNSNTLLDNTDNLKVGDKVIDSNGVLFSVTAIDTQNSTFTIGTALIDLAQDSDVVHVTGNETKNGELTVTKLISNSIQSATGIIQIQSLGTNRSVAIYNGSSAGDGGGFWAYGKDSANGSDCRLQIYNTAKSRYERVDLVNSQFLPTPSGELDCGGTSNKWKSVYATNYYYGNDNVEFSTKFVTTDTAQTISGDKVWTGASAFQQNVTYQRTNFYHQVANPCYILKDTELEKGSLASTHTAYPGLWHDKNGNILGYVRFVEYSSGRQTAEIRVSNLIKNGALDPTGSEVNCAVNLELQPSGEKSLIPELNNDINLGTSTNKWKTFNGVEPSSLSLPVAPSSTSYVDISSYITVLDNSAPNKFTPPSNGYITFHVKGSQVQFMHDYGLQVKWSVQSGSVNRGFVPVLGGVEIDIYVAATDIYKFWFIPCQGNV